MGKNNSRAQRELRRDRAWRRQQDGYRPMSYWDDERKGWRRTGEGGLAWIAAYVQQSIGNLYEFGDISEKTEKVFNQFTNIDDKHSEIIREIYNG